MMDLSYEKGLGSTDRSTRAYPESDLDGTKSCADCLTTKTPLWRAGPAGPKSLCNACGIRYRKSRRVVLDLNGGGKKTSRKMGVSVKLMGLGKDVVLLKQRRSVIQKLKQGMLREEEEAAVLLMALSSGRLYASHH